MSDPFPFSESELADLDFCLKSACYRPCARRSADLPWTGAGGRHYLAVGECKVIRYGRTKNDEHDFFSWNIFSKKNHWILGIDSKKSYYFLEYSSEIVLYPYKKRIVTVRRMNGTEFPRTVEARVRSLFFSGKIIVLVGPRQVWKTTLSEKILAEFPQKRALRLFGDYHEHRELFESRHAARLFESVAGYDVIFVDEAQKIENVGESLKILVDRFKKEKQILVTGSSSFHLLNQTTESLAGRKRVVRLFPVSFDEYAEVRGLPQSEAEIETLVTYGQYPAVLNTPSPKEKEAELSDLTGSALYRDILELQSVKSSSTLVRLLKILALSIGSEISMHAIGQELSLEARTVERYVDLLEKCYVVFRLPPYFTNKRKEIVKMQKVYFYDTGIRNSVLGNFLPFSSRNDAGALWENWVLAERMKLRSYGEWTGVSHFWRSNAQQEIDLIEDSAGALSAFEIKWSPKGSKIPSGFRTLYGDVPYEEINRENFWRFVR